MGSGVPNMKTTSKIVAYLLGLMFVVFGLNFWFHFINTPTPPADSPAGAFINAIYGSGYLAVVKAIEVIGGLALLSCRARRLGIILISAVTFNIVTFHVAFFGWGSLIPSASNAPVLFALVASLYLAYSHRLFCCVSGCGCCSKDGSGSCCSGCNCGTSGCCSDKAESSSCCSTAPSEKKSGGCGCN